MTIRNIFLDTNVLIDTLHSGESSVYSSLILSFCRVFTICISAESFVDIAYLAGRKRGAPFIPKRIKTLFDYCSILPVNKNTITSATESNCPDFEDAMQISCAEEANCDVIVTGNKRHFEKYTTIPVFTPKEFIEKLQEQAARSDRT